MNSASSFQHQESVIIPAVYSVYMIRPKKTGPPW